jgi:hypothetical protein
MSVVVGLPLVMGRRISQPLDQILDDRLASLSTHSAGYQPFNFVAGSVVVLGHYGFRLVVVWAFERVRSLGYFLEVGYRENWVNSVTRRQLRAVSQFANPFEYLE